MSFLIDTNVAIGFRDYDPVIDRALEHLPTFPSLSIISATELEGGVARERGQELFRRTRLDDLLGTLTIHPYGIEESREYGRIVDVLGYSRPKMLDRMIAATALVHGLTLITANPADFKNIPGLVLLDWSVA